jgi:hypothetical protein
VVADIDILDSHLVMSALLMEVLKVFIIVEKLSAPPNFYKSSGNLEKARSANVFLPKAGGVEK